MHVFHHPLNHDVIISNNSHSVFMCRQEKEGWRQQIDEGISHLEDMSKRCFEFDQEMTNHANGVEETVLPPDTLPKHNPG